MNNAVFSNIRLVNELMSGFTVFLKINYNNERKIYARQKKVKC